MKTERERKISEVEIKTWLKICIIKNKKIIIVTWINKMYIHTMEYYVPMKKWACHILQLKRNLKNIM